MLKWLRLKAKVGTHDVGALLEVDGTNLTEATARGYITAGLAEDGGEGPERGLAETVTAELDNLRSGLTAAINGIVEDIRGAGERLNAPRVDPTASEDDKVYSGQPFRSLGHFAHVVRTGNMANPEPASRDLVNRYAGAADKVTRAATGASEAIDGDGGLLVPPDRSDAIWQRVIATENLAARVPIITVSGNSLTLPALNDSSRANGFRQGGIASFWTGEAEQYQKSKLSFRALEAKLKKLTVLSYMTDELMADVPALESFLGRTVPNEFNFKLSDAILFGTGAGMPKGIAKGDNKIIVAKESGQAAATIVYLNVVKMWNRLHAASRKNAVWLANQDTEPQLETMVFATGTASGTPIYVPSGAGPQGYGTLKGRPIVIQEQCETLGTEGDLMLADLSNVLAIAKGGVRSAVSMHLRFDYGEVAFRWDIRFDSQPYEDAPVTPYKGSTTTSSLVTLATRS